MVLSNITDLSVKGLIIVLNLSFPSRTWGKHYCLLAPLFSKAMRFLMVTVSILPLPVLKKDLNGKMFWVE